MEKLKTLIIKLIRLYQRTPLKMHYYCRFVPRCSEYMIISLERHGLLKGMFYGAKRILRCNPFGKTGIDPVPPLKGENI